MRHAYRKAFRTGDPNRLAAMTMKLRKVAGLEGVRFHDLRHTFATNLVDDGVDLHTVQELMGHADVSMTMRYCHATVRTRSAARWRAS